MSDVEPAGTDFDCRESLLNEWMQNTMMTFDDIAGDEESSRLYDGSSSET